MTITAQLHDGTVLEFPDGTDPAVIQNTVKNMIDKQNQEPSLIEEAQGVGEVAANIGSSIVAEPIAGIAGIVTSLIGDSADGAKTVDVVRNALTFDPKTKEGKAKLKSLGETLEPVGKAISSTEKFLGDAVLEATGEPALAAMAHSLPTAALEALGVKGLRSTRLKDAKLSSNIAEAIQQSAPDIGKLQTAKNNAYSALDDYGINVKANVYDNFANGINSRMIKEGVDQTLTPKSNAALKRIVDAKGTPKTLSELDTLRKIAKSAANDIDKADARLGTIIVNELDKGVDALSSQIGGKFKEARGLAQRAFKSQDISDMIENASHTASGMENGLRIEARKILKSKKRRKGFSADELASLKQIEQGTTAANAAKFLGKFGISEGQATSMLGASIGIGGGGAIGSVFGPAGAAAGAIAVPAIGQFAKNTAQRITLNNTKFADDLVRSGNNAKGVVRTYLKHTPRGSRSVSDLTDLLLDPNLKIDDIKSLPKSAEGTAKLVADAKYFANEIKRRATQGASLGVIANPSTQTQE